MEDEADFHVVAEVSKEPWPSHLKVDVPDFSVRDCTDINLIGLGAFGEVSACVYREHKYVLKQLNVGYDRIQSRDMYIKELKLLESVRGHNNIIHIRAYCFSERYFMLDYMRFSFDCLGIECQQVSSLDKFLAVCNDYTKFRGCKHLPLHIIMDVANGLQFLHSTDIVHRDLKAENVLVCNRHYTETEQRGCSFEASWTSCTMQTV